MGDSANRGGVAGDGEDVEMEDEEVLRAAMGKATASIQPISEEVAAEAKVVY